MTRTLHFLCALLVTQLGVFAAESKPAATESQSLQVQVDVPAMVDPLHEDDVIEVFADSIRDAFRRRGYDGKIEELDRAADPKPDLPLLHVRLIRWERTRTGDVECAFSASLRPAGGKERSLGMFTQTELGLMITNRFTLHEAFRDAAERAADEMYRRIAEQNVIPGIRKTDRS